MADGTNPFSQYDAGARSIGPGQSAPTRYVSTISGPVDAQGRALLPLIRRLEGSGDQAVSPAGAIGRNQIMPATARAYGFDPARLSDPAYNDLAAAAILTHLDKVYNGDTDAVLIGYNSTPQRAARFLASGRNPSVLLPETQKYLQHADQILGRGDANPFAQYATPSQAPPNPFAQFDPAASASNPFEKFAPPAAPAKGGTGGFADAVQRLWNSALGGAEEGTANALAGVGHLGDLYAQTMAQGAAETGTMYEPGAFAPVPVPDTMRPGFAQVASQHQPVASQFTQPAAGTLARTAAATAPANRSMAESIAYGAGQFAPAIAAGVVNPAAAPVLFGAQGFEQAHQEALAAGQPEEVAQRAGLESGALQAGLGALPVTEFIGGPGASLLESAAGHVAGGALVGAGMQVGSNVVAQQNYDPTRTWSQGVSQAALDMALAGGVIHAATGGAAAVRNAVGARLTPRAGVAAGMPTSMPATNALADYIGAAPAAPPEPAGAPTEIAPEAAVSAPPETAAGRPPEIPVAPRENAPETAASDEIPPAVPATARELLDGVSPAEIASAAHDVDEWKAAAPRGYSIFQAIKDLGGVAVKDENGAPLAGPDVQGALQDVRRPGLINNKTGLSPEYMAQQLADHGWFGPNWDGDSNDLTNALDQEAHGRKVYHPDADTAAQLVRREMLDHDMAMAGVLRRDDPAIAAAKLARYRQDAANALSPEGQALGVRADELGVTHSEITPQDELLADVLEREAIQGEASQSDADAYERSVNLQLTAADRRRLEELARTGPGSESYQGAPAEPLPAGWESEPGVPEAYREPAQGPGGAGENPPTAPPEIGRELATERMNLGGETVEQGVMPGMEASARQAAAAREGPLRAGAAQEEAGGRFAPKEENPFNMFDPDRDPNKPRFQRANVERESHLRRLVVADLHELGALLTSGTEGNSSRVRELTSAIRKSAVSADLDFSEPIEHAANRAHEAAVRRYREPWLTTGEYGEGRHPGVPGATFDSAAERASARLHELVATGRIPDRLIHDLAVREHDYQKSSALELSPQADRRGQGSLDRSAVDREDSRGSQGRLFSRPPGARLSGTPEPRVHPLVDAVRLETPSAREQALIDHVDSILARIAPMAESRAYASIAERATGAPLHGMEWRDGLRRIIGWSLEAPDAEHTARHEAVHTLRASGVITPDEWSTLASAALSEGWLDRFRIRERYGDLTMEQQIEEAVAERFATWRRDSVSALPPAIAAVFKRIAMVLQQLGDGLRRVFGRAATADDVFNRIETGEVGKRPIGSAVGREEPRLDRSEKPRRFGIPKEATSISSHHSVADITSHPDYRAAKSGDREAAYNLVRDRVGAKAIATANEKFGPGALYVPVHAQEAAGRNKIPSALAAHYAAATDGSAVGDIIQTNKSYHTGARPMPRLIRRALFSGPVKPGGRYVLVDDVNVMGSTLAELANHIRSNGGEVIGVATLANQSRTGLYAARPEHVRLLEARHGNEIHDNLGLPPSALTGDEAAYLANFRDTDSLRAGIAKARSEEQPGILPGAPSGGIKFARPDDRAVERTRGLFNNILGAGAESVGRKLQAKAEAAIPEPVAELLDAVKTGVSPMGMGSERSQAETKDFANARRAAAFQWGRVDEWLTKTFTPEQRQRMWTAADEHGVILRQGREPEANEGKNRLAPDERAAVEELQVRADAAFRIAQDRGMVQGDGLESYVPRMIVEMTIAGPKIVSRATPRQIERGANLSTTTGQLRQRKYETVEETEAAAKTAFGENTQVVRDIRTLALGTQRLEQAIAGRTLVDKIKEISAQAGGGELVVEGANPDDNAYFTLDHPALQKWGPKYTTTPDGKYVPVVDQNGDVVFEAYPLFISREFEGPLKAVLSTRTSGVARALMDLKAKVLSIIMYSPLIHNAVIWGKAIPADPVGVLTFQAYFRGHAAKLDPKIMSEAIQAGMDPIGHRYFNQDITGIAAAEGQDIAPGRSWSAQMLGYVPSLFDKEAGNEVKRFVDKLGDVWHNTFLWDRIADLQAGLYVHFRDKLIADGEDPLSAQRVAAHFANRYAGALPMESLSKIARTTANLVLFSRSFTLGNVALFKDAVMGLPSDVRAQILRDAGRAGLDNIQGVARQKAAGMLALDVALSVAGLALASSAVAWMTAQKAQFPWQNEPGKEQRFLIGYQQDGTAIYGRLPTGKVGEELWDWPTDFRDTLLRKLSPYGRLMYGLAANDKGFGRKIYDPYDHTPLGFAKNLGRVMAFAAGGIAPESQIQAMHDAIVGGQGIDRKTAALGAIGPALGLTISRGAPGGPAMADVYQVKDEQQFRWQEARADVFRQIKGGDVAGAQARMTALGVSPSLQRYYIRTAINPASRMSKRALQDFMLAATPEQKARLTADRAAEAARSGRGP